MTIVAESNTNSNTYSVIRSISNDGYLVQADEYSRAASCEGWDILVSGVELSIAERIATIYRNAGKTQSPSFDDLLTYDMTLPIEERVSEFASEYDLVAVEYQGRVIEAVITFWDDETVELDGFIEMPVSQFLATATLIAKADADCGFVTEYSAYIIEQQERMNALYNIAVETSLGMAA